MPDVELFVGGQSYGGWKTATIQRSVTAFAGSFQLDVTDNWMGTGSIFFIRPGDECKLKINGQPVITGYVEQIENGFDAQGHSISISGRDKTGDLVDCSAIYGQGEILNSDLLQIAQALAEPFGLTVKADADVGDPFANFCLQGGESVFDALDRAARLRGLMFSTDGLGNVVITKLAAGRAATSLIEGQNIKQATLSIDTKDRFSKYICKGQITGTDENYGELAAHPEGQVADATINRYRPLVIIAENQANTADAIKRAQWEAAVRAAKSWKVTVTVQGFEQQADGPLWRINEMIYIESRTLGLKQTMLITDVTMTLSDAAGRITTLVLQRPDAYFPEPEVKKKGDVLAKYRENVSGE